MSESRPAESAVWLDRRCKVRWDRGAFRIGMMSNLGPKGNGHRTGRSFRHPVVRRLRSLIDQAGVSLAVGFPGLRHRRCRGRAFVKLMALASRSEEALEPFSGFGEYSFLPGPGALLEADYAAAKSAEEEAEEEEAEVAAAAAVVDEVADDSL